MKLIGSALLSLPSNEKIGSYLYELHIFWIIQAIQSLVCHKGAVKVEKQYIIFMLK